MAVNLTRGAITAMCSDDSNSEDLKPVLQVVDLKLVTSQQNTATERYRMVLSDGTHYQQGMLATQKNELVHSGTLQKGSVVKLTQFICNVVQNRKIIIIIELDVILEKCDLIGEPLPAPRGVTAQPASGQSGVTSGNSQSLNSSSHAGGMAARPNVAGPSVDHPKVNHPAGSVYSSAASNAAPTYPKSKPGVILPRLAPFSGFYGDQNMGLSNTQSEASRPMRNSYACPPQPMYRQPPPMNTMARNEAAPSMAIPITTFNPYQNVWRTGCDCNFIFFNFDMTFYYYN